MQLNAPGTLGTSNCVASEGGLPGSTAPQKTAVFYHPELDVLRFCAFLMVFACHAIQNAPLGVVPLRLKNGIHLAGSYGVDLFFALSAYLITEILLRERRSRGDIDIKAFYIRRILRIWPLYFFFLAFAFWIQPLLVPQIFPLSTKLAFLVFLGNWHFLLPPMQNAVGILWSVSIEEQFYLSWPLVLRHARHFKGICLGLLLVASCYRIVLVIGRSGLDPLWYSTFSRLDPIALGALLAFHLDGRIPNLRKGTRILLFFSSAGAFAVFGGVLGEGYGIRCLITYPAIALACVGLLGATLSPAAGRPLGFFKSKLVHCGRISYGLYVFHGFAIQFSRKLIPVGDSIWEWALQVCFAAFLTFTLALISYRWLESPFLKLKDRFSFVRSHS